MSLSKCTECGGKVSTKATHCPSCGAPVKKKSNPVALVLWSGVLVVVVMQLAPLFDSTPAPATRPPDSAEDAKAAENRRLLQERVKTEFAQAKAKFEKEEMTGAYDTMMKVMDSNPEQAEAKMALFEKFGRMDFKDVALVAPEIKRRVLLGKLERTPAAEHVERARLLDEAVRLSPGDAPLAKRQREAHAAVAAAKEAEMDRTDEAWVIAQQFVKDALKSPSTASFGGLLTEYQNPRDLVRRQADGSYAVAMWVDSQNSFGATTRSHFHVKLRYVGRDNWQLVEPLVHRQR